MDESAGEFRRIRGNVYRVGCDRCREKCGDLEKGGLWVIGGPGRCDIEKFPPGGKPSPGFDEHGDPVDFVLSIVLCGKKE